MSHPIGPEHADDIPRHLLKQLRRLRHKHKKIGQVFIDKKNVHRSEKTRRPFSYLHGPDQQSLSVRAYRGLPRKLFPYCSRTGVDYTRIVLVATGGSLQEPVILGRATEVRKSGYRIWRGKQGFDNSDAGRVYKIACGPPIKSGQVDEESSSSEEDPDDSLFKEGDDTLDEDYTPPHDHISRALPVPPPTEVNDTAEKLGLHDTPEVVIASSPTIKMETSTVGNGSNQWTGDQSITAIEDASICFVSSIGIVARERSFDACDTIGKFFMQAALARIIEIGDEAAAIAASVGGRAIWIMRGDKQDFEALRQAIARETARKEAGGLLVYVRAL